MGLGLFKNNEAKVMLIGLDGAGKTTIAYKLELNDKSNLNLQHIPTIGIGSTKIRYQDINFTFFEFDLGPCQQKLKQLFRQYYNYANAIIFVIESNDRERIIEAREELFNTISDYNLNIESTILLIFGNKQDLPGALNEAELIDKLHLHKLKQVNWFIQPCCAISGQGLVEGFDWLYVQLKKII
ncbi:hypothetical protein ABK040_015608 [Willaertia magna]